MKLEKLKEFFRAYQDQPISYDDIFHEPLIFMLNTMRKKLF